MSISPPPRPPELGDPAHVDQEALIEEARRRAQRRRQRNLAGVLAAMLGALWLYSLLGGGGPRNGSAFLSESSSQVGVPAEPVRANGRIAFIAGWRTNTTPVFRIDMINPDGSGRRTLVRCETPQIHCGYGAFAYSPNGKRFAFDRGVHVCCAPNGQRPDVPLFVVKADGSGEKRLPGCGLPFAECGPTLAWAPDNRRIAFTRAGSIYVVDARGGPPVRITHGRFCCVSGPLWSPDGSTVLFGTQRPVSPWQTSIYRVNADGTGLRKLADGAGQPTWSPDGLRIAFVVGNSIAAMDADGSNVVPLFTAGNGPKGTSPQFPAWSPDGAQIAFGMTPDTTPGTPGGFVSEVWTMRADGTQPRRLFRSNVLGDVPLWSPDGKLMAIAGPAGNGVNIVHTTGKPRRRLLTAAAAGFAWQSVSRPNG